MIVHHYKPGETLTLFEGKRHKQFAGRVYFVTTQILPYKKLAIACLLIGLMGLSKLFIPIALSATQYHASVPVSPSPVPQPVLSVTTLPEPETTEFNITIPKLSLQSDIIPNVDPSSEQEYNLRLKQAVAHAKDSYLPKDKKGPVILFAHSTDSIENILAYNAKFYGVKDLVQGDEIAIQYHGKLYRYIVSSKRVIDPKQVDVLRESDADLILETCYPPGTDWKRLITFAQRID